MQIKSESPDHPTQQTIFCWKQGTWGRGRGVLRGEDSETEA